MRRLFTHALWMGVALTLIASPSQSAWAARRTQNITPVGDGGLVALWRRPLVRQAPYRSVSDSFGAPAISTRHKLVVAGSAEGVLWAFALYDGKPLWRRKIGVPIEGEVAIFSQPEGAPSGELAVVGLHDGRLLAVDVKSGKKMWETTLGAEARARPVALESQHLVVTTVHNEVALLNAKDGAVRWVAGRAPPSGLSLQGHARALVVQGRVFATFSDGFAAAFALRDGQELWSRPLSLRGGRFVDADAHPQWVDNKLIVASVSDGVFALNPSDGTTLWQQPLRHVGGLAGLGNELFAANVDGQLYRLDPKNGHQRTRIRMGAEAVAALTPFDGGLLLAAGDWGLLRLDGHGLALGAQAIGARPGDGFATCGPFVAHITRDGHLIVWRDALRPASSRRTVSQACSFNTGLFASSAPQ